MTENNFRNIRRQKFLTEKYFQLNSKIISDAITINSGFSLHQLPSDDSTKYQALASVFKNQLKLIRLEYTAGTNISNLAKPASKLADIFEAWSHEYSNFVASLARKTKRELDINKSPLLFEDLFYFQQGLDAVSINILLGQGNAVRKIASLLPNYRGKDMLFEAVIEPAVSDQSEPETFFHENPYGFLVDAIFTADTPVEASQFVKSYLENWYKSFEGAPWHNGHLAVTDEYSNYEGYWAFDAAAVCVIYNIDDSSFRDHIFYPKDFADWARINHTIKNINQTDGSVEKIRCQAGEICPRTGWWFTPALKDSRQYFESGTTLPQYPSDYGVNIWQWDGNQQ